MRISTNHLNRANIPPDGRERRRGEPENIPFVRNRPFPVFGILAFIVIAAAAFIAVPRFLKKDYRAEVIADLRAIHDAEEIYRAKISRYQSYGNFTELTEAGLLAQSSKVIIGCENCDERNLWFGKNRRFQFEIRKSPAGTNYCIAAISDSKSDRAFAVAPNGTVYEDDADKISCATSPATKISAETNK